MFTIKLNNLVFKANHGLYDEEKILGNTFIVNASVCYNPNTAILSLEDCVDYGKVFFIINKKMNTYTPLLETLAYEMCDDILKTFLQVSEVDICITKKNPPIKNCNGDVTVCYKSTR